MLDLWPPLRVSSEVTAAIDAGSPVVALESALISHGLPAPLNLETALGLERAVRDEGAVPATVAVIDGALRVGVDRSGLETLAGGEGVAKVSHRDLAAVVAAGVPGGTTVAGTLVGARLAGIRFFATGGIGGVHRGASESFDVSADLEELARSPVAVVCSGAKAILDLAATLEVLESRGVPVVGLGTDELPAFLAPTSGLPLPHRVDTAAAAARLAATHWRLGLAGAVVFVQPPPADRAIAATDLDRWLGTALSDPGATAIRGADVTPELLRRLAEASGGRTVAANVALLEANARQAARIAVASCGLRPASEADREP